MSAAAASASDSKETTPKPKRKTNGPASRKSTRVAKRAKENAPKPDGPKSIYDAFVKLDMDLVYNERNEYESKLAFPEDGKDTCPKCGKVEVEVTSGIKGIGYHSTNRCEDGHHWWPLSRELEAKDPGWSNSFSRWLKWIGEKAARVVFLTELAKKTKKIQKQLGMMDVLCDNSNSLPLFHNDSDLDLENDNSDNDC